MAEQKMVQGKMPATAFLFRSRTGEWQPVSTDRRIADIQAEADPHSQGAVIKFKQQFQPFTKIEVNFPK